MDLSAIDINVFAQDFINLTVVDDNSLHLAKKAMQNAYNATDEEWWAMCKLAANLGLIKYRDITKVAMLGLDLWNARKGLF